MLTGLLFFAVGEILRRRSNPHARGCHNLTRFGFHGTNMNHAVGSKTVYFAEEHDAAVQQVAQLDCAGGFDRYGSAQALFRDDLREAVAFHHANGAQPQQGFRGNVAEIRLEVGGIIEGTFERQEHRRKRITTECRKLPLNLLPEILHPHRKVVMLVNGRRVVGHKSRYFGLVRDVAPHEVNDDVVQSSC